MKIKIETIPHREQRYNTVGDWQWGSVDSEKDFWSLCIRVSRMPDPRFEYLIAVHELVEAILCDVEGVSEGEVDAWDLQCKDEEPGANPDSPYYQQHDKATRIENHLMYYLLDSLSQEGKKYSEAINAATRSYKVHRKGKPRIHPRKRR